MKTLLSIIAASSIALASTSFAGPSTYQVTGPVTALTDTVITVQKGKDLWQIAKTADTKVTGDLKVGSKVTVTYTMTAASIEAKADKPAKADKAAAKTAASPAASPAAK